MKYTQSEKAAFAENFKNKTRKFAVDVIKFCRTLPREAACNIIVFQLIKSATSTGANYRAATRARSQKEFFAKLCIATEEADESEYWLLILKDSEITCDKIEGQRLLEEANQILRVLAKARNTTGQK
jgi:four helix bundle protein